MKKISLVMSLCRRFSRDKRGVAAVEFSVILPAMLLMFFGTFEVSSLIRAKFATNRAAQLIANLVAQEPTGSATSGSGTVGFTASDSTDFCTAAKLAMAPFPGSSFKATIASASKNSSGVIAFDWTPQADTTCGGGAGTFLDPTAASNGLLVNKGDSVIIVKVQYNYSSPIHFVLPSGYTITQSAYQRPRSPGVIPHT